MYGLAAGIFFIGYFPPRGTSSNLVLVRVGARPWLARIMISWGLVVIAMVPDTRRGLLPHAALPARGRRGQACCRACCCHLSRWVPRARLALAFSILMATTALRQRAERDPIATTLMQLDGLAGLRAAGSRCSSPKASPRC